MALAAFLFALGKGADWAIGKLRAGTKDAVSPLTIDMAAAKIEIRQLDEKLNAFKIEVARTYVTGDVISRLEHRIDDMVTSVRQEMKETRDMMLKAITGRPPS
ncbi:hypothetical protein [Methylorubrum rhodesianum]|uniref:hypothetical protein n=1 Tax=Methylorubrum rhodesianum TaxID=29427 RepID=UPI0037478094